MCQVAQARLIALATAFYRAMAPKILPSGRIDVSEGMSERDRIIGACIRAYVKRDPELGPLSSSDEEEEKDPIHKEADNFWDQTFDHMRKQREAGEPFAIDFEFQRLSQQNGRKHQPEQCTCIVSQRPAKHARNKYRATIVSQQTRLPSSNTQAATTTSTTESQVDAPIDIDAEQSNANSSQKVCL